MTVAICDRCGSRTSPSLVEDGECATCRGRDDGFDPQAAMLEHATEVAE